MIMFKKNLRTRKHVSMDDYQLKQLYAKPKKENIPNNNGINKIEEKYGLKNYNVKNPFITEIINNYSLDNNLPTNASDKVIPLEYLDEIFNTLLDEQVVIGNCLAQQAEINPRMRMILVHWLYEVHYKFKLRPETLFLTINIVDRYLAQKQVERTNFQLLGTVSLWIASKYEEIYFPEVKDLEYICDKTYPRQDFLAAEGVVLNGIGYYIPAVTPLNILNILDCYFTLSPIELNFTKMVAELCLFNHNANFFSPALIVGSGLFVIKKMLNSRVDQLESILNILKINEHEIAPCRNIICELLDNINVSYLLPVKNKYAGKEYAEVSDFKRLKLI
jgi:hypothetical protein